MPKEQIESANEDYAKAVLRYNFELSLHAQSQLRYAKALINYQQAFADFLCSREKSDDQEASDAKTE